MNQKRIDVSNMAKVLSKLGAARGGRARAEKLSPTEKSDIARQAAAARWSRVQVGAAHVPLAAYGSADRPLRIGEIAIPAYVLDDGRRMLAQRGMQAGIGMSTSGGSGGAQRLARFVATLEDKGLDSKGLSVRIGSPVMFRAPGIGGPIYGYEATILTDLCDAVLEARARGLLMKQQLHIAAQCETLARGLARVGIIALVDEATGYQSQRAHDALARILEKFIAKELRPYVKTFPPDFYQEIYRLRGEEYPPKQNRHNSYIGKITNDLVYDRLAPGVREELQRLTERYPSGRLKTKLHQRLTTDFGHPKLREHLGGVVMAMKLSTDWELFMATINRILPKYLPTEDKHGQRTLPFEAKAPGTDGSQRKRKIAEN